MSDLQIITIACIFIVILVSVAFIFYKIGKRVQVNKTLELLDDYPEYNLPDDIIIDFIKDAKTKLLSSAEIHDMYKPVEFKGFNDDENRRGI